MKTESLIVVLLVVGLIIVSGLQVIKPINIDLRSESSGIVGMEKTIQVNGQSILSVNPDKAEIILGVETQEKNALDSQQKNAEIMEKVMNALKANGIKSSDIQTYQYSLYPVRNYNTERSDFSEIVAYNTVNIVKIKTTDLDNTGKVIDAAASAGANVFQGISFGLTDEKQVEYRNKALKEASENAREKADSIADGLDISITGISSVSESSYYEPLYRSYDMVKASGSPMEATTEISSGMIQISANVAVSYEFG